MSADELGVGVGAGVAVGIGVGVGIGTPVDGMEPPELTPAPPLPHAATSTLAKTAIILLMHAGIATRPRPCILNAQPPFASMSTNLSAGDAAPVVETMPVLDRKKRTRADRCQRPPCLEALDVRVRSPVEPGSIEHAVAKCEVLRLGPPHGGRHRARPKMLTQ